MSELTKEHFDQVVAGLAAKEQIEELARMTKHGFDDVLERLDVRERVYVVEQNVQRIAEALQIKL